VFAKEPIEISWISKSKTVTDLFDGKIELQQARARFLDQPRMNDGARADAFLALAMCVKLVVCNA
jgi:hypothetical protein